MHVLVDGLSEISNKPDHRPLKVTFYDEPGIGGCGESSLLWL